jgi:hypothetical protein
MKTSITAILALAGAATVAAADFPSNMPACGRTCGTNMLGKAAEFKCKAEDIACLCKDKNFVWGIRDCSQQSCGSVDDANVAINWGNQVCADAGFPVGVPPADGVATSTGGSGGSPTKTGDDAATTTGSGSDNGDNDDATKTGDAAATTTGSGSGDDDNENGDATAITTSTWTSTFTSGDATSTATGTTTISGVNGVPDDSSDAPESTVTSPIVSTHTGESTTFETTIGSTTIAGGDDAEGTQPSDNNGATSTSTALGAHMTAAPAFGFIAAAGIAAAFL